MKVFAVLAAVSSYFAIASLPDATTLSMAVFKGKGTADMLRQDLPLIHDFGLPVTFR
ncbi:MAG: hypothetical protein KAW00_06190 [Dehalococcoidia bacterium]|nr:hypothetical protein [Dehalococcoidia bacterium]